MNAGLQPAYVLHTRRYGENSLIVELLTQGYGRIGVLAKGALSGKKAAQNRLQPFTPLLTAWRGRGELPLLTAAEAAGSVRLPSGKALYCGLYVNELVLRLTQRADPHSQLFPAYVACLDRLSRCAPENAALEPILRRFELDLLDELGLGLQLHTDQSGQVIQATQRYHYDADSGPRPALGQETSISGATLQKLADGQLDDTLARREARGLMRQLIAHHLDGAPLTSRELFKH
jgi:DNA repair protein RecO (recombination protein O)